MYKYIAGIIKGKDQKPIIVNGMSDHIHVFIGLKPSMAISDLVRDVKNNSSNFINKNRFVNGKFQWQEGYGAFLILIRIYRKYMIIFSIRKLIIRRKHFREEYTELLKKFEIEHDEKYLFEWIE